MKTITKKEMPDGTIKTTVKYIFKIFGWNIYISNHALHTRPRMCGSHTTRDQLIAQREKIVGGKTCEICGREQTKYICLHRTLPKGHPDRSKVENVRIVCNECHHELEKNPHYHGLRHMESESRMDGVTPTI